MSWAQFSKKSQRLLLKTKKKLQRIAGRNWSNDLKTINFTPSLIFAKEQALKFQRRNVYRQDAGTLYQTVCYV